MTVLERSLAVDAASLGGPRTPEERLHFAESVGRYLSRVALPNVVNDVLRPFVRRVAERYDRNSAEGKCAQQVSELRVEATPDFDHENPALRLLVIIEERNLPAMRSYADLRQDRIDSLVSGGTPRAAQAVVDAETAVEKREAWAALAECWLQPASDLAGSATGVSGIEVSILNGEELSYARSRNAPILDVRYLSTRPA
jgi:hypothetical protein